MTAHLRLVALGRSALMDMGGRVRGGATDDEMGRWSE